MARILVVYGTTDGHTAKVAHEMGAALRTAGAEARVLRASPSLAGPAGYDGVIIAASLQAGGYQKPVRRWVQRHHQALNQLPTAFISVCLSVRDPAAAPALAAIMARFEDRCGWRPTVTKPVAGALLYRKYNWLKRWMMRRIVASHGGETDTSRDYEYTDWNDVRRFASEFLDVMATHQPSHQHVAGIDLSLPGPMRTPWRVQ